MGEGMLTRNVNITLGLLVCAIEGYACTVSAPFSSDVLFEKADAIVRAAAVEYAVPPGDPRIRTTGEPDSRIRFRVVESIRGGKVQEVILSGYLSDEDDFNDQEPPYTFVRPGGRHGSCFANTYRRDAEFLLFLQKTPAGEWTVNWYPLAPANEQLHSEEDPWLAWVRKQVKAGR